MVRKVGLVVGVGVVWLLTFFIMGGDLRPNIDLNADTPVPSATSGPVGTTATDPAPTPTSGADAGTPPGPSTSAAAALAEKLAGSKALPGPKLRARPGPRRFSAPVLQFRMSTFNVLGSSHTVGGKRNRASGTTRAARAAEYVLDHEFSVVGFQEFQPNQRAAFTNATGGRFGLYPDNQLRSQDGDNSIAWRKSDWDLVSAQSIALPYFHGRERYFPYVQLRNKQTGITAWFSNFHNPANIGGNMARFRNASKVKQIDLFQTLGRQGLPVFATGDMNERNSWACEIVGPSDMRAAAGGDGRDGCSVSANNVVDWIVGSYDVGFSNYTIDDSPLIDSITDHPVIYVDVRIDSRDFPKSVK